MNNEQNEKLCKLLGINPKYKLVYGMLDDDFWILDKEQCENHINNTKNIYYTPHIEDKEVYPDLYAPSNFVKLLRVYGSICGQLIIFMTKTGYELELDLIKEVMFAMKTRNKKFKTLMIKQAQQTDWEY